MTSAFSHRFSRAALDLDAARETHELVTSLQDAVFRQLRKRGAVVGVSGGVDSAVVLALAARACSPGRVVALLLPERDSEPASESLARAAAAHYGVEAVCENISAALEGFGCYQRRDAAIRAAVPSYDPSKGDQAKIVLPGNLLEEGTLNTFQLKIVAADGTETSHALPPDLFLRIVAASNFKQRSRMALLYYHAECRNYAVAGTANRDEHEQGFFVKHGDGGVDVQPIQHLFKTQVFQLAEYLDVPTAIRERVPTTDTYSATCSQQEFFFRLPFETLDLLWYAHDHALSPEEVAGVLNMNEAQVRRAYRDLEAKSRAANYLRMPPLVLKETAS